MKNVPQEQIDQIIDLYVNKQFGLQRIIKTLNLDVGPTVVKRILKENNIHIRDFSEAKIGRIKIEIPKELRNQIVNLYNRGYGLEKISSILQTNFGVDVIKRILIEDDVHIRNCQESSQVKIMPDLRKYPVDDFYHLESHNGAWLLGFVAADGYLPITKGAKNKIVISLARKDEEVLHQIAKELCYEGPVYQYKASDGVNNISSLSFASKILRQKFEHYGITNNKTYKINRLPNLPKEFIIDYIHGFFDGDGSVFKSKDKKINMSITCASESFLKEIAQFLHDEYGLSEKNILRDHNNYCIRYGVKDSLILGDLFYNNDYLSLQRKKDVYHKIITSTSLNTPQE